ncbi:MAG TPA: glutamate racemase [Solirubrobacteraceae bacterium]
MPGRRDPIAVFDSGVGGLTVLHELLVTLPHEDFLYLGDTARFPYGERAAEELERFVVEIGTRLLAHGAKLLVIACNSATAAGMAALQTLAATGIDVVGVVTPESHLAAEATRNGRIGLLGTRATVASGAYARAVAAVDPSATLFPVACPELAPIIQCGFPFDERVVDTVRTYCAPLKEARVDTVILGCTHYPLVRPMLQRILGRGVTLISSGPAIAGHIERTLTLRGLLNDREGEGDYSFECTGDVDAFRDLGTRFLQMPLGEVRHVELAPAAPVLS